VSSFRFSIPRPPEDAWKRRLILGVVGVLALGAVGVAVKGGSSTTTPATVAATPAATTTTAPPAPTSTTVDPKAISAGVANLYSHEGATPQQLAAAPSSAKAAGAHHAKSGGTHPHH